MTPATRNAIFLTVLGLISGIALYMASDLIGDAKKVPGLERDVTAQQKRVDDHEDRIRELERESWGRTR